MVKSSPWCSLHLPHHTVLDSWLCSQNYMWRHHLPLLADCDNKVPNSELELVFRLVQFITREQEALRLELLFYRHEEVLRRVKEQRNSLHEISKWKDNWIAHILHRNCLQQRVTEGKIKGGIEATGRRRRCKKLLDDHKERRGYSHLKEEALDHTVWRARFGIGSGLVVRQTTKWMNEFLKQKLSVRRKN
jgi:hypothetical protein